MKVSEIWDDTKDRLTARGHHDTFQTASIFAGGLRAAAVEILTHCKDVLNDEDANKLSARFMAAADRIEAQR